MTARIFKPAKSAMSSGEHNTKDWVLEFEPSQRRRIDPLMGWTSSGDMGAQVQLRFTTREEAERYAARHGLAYVVEDAKPRAKTIRPMGYGGNYAHNRRQAWTH
ncbi:MAG: ETC complex I subunit [Pseudomonadota bacterium]